MSLADNGSEYIAAVGKVTPPIAISGVALAGMSLQEWVLILTALYTAIQIIVTVRKFLRDRANGG